MKRIIFSVLLFVAALGMTANAVDNTNITIEDAEVSLDVPNDCYVLFQNVDENHPYLEKTGAQKEKVEEYYKEAGIYLNAVAMDDSYEIVATLKESPNVDYIYNMHSLSDEQMEVFANTIESTYSNYGYTIDGHKTYSVDDADASYLCFSFSQNYENNNVNCKQYYTIRDNRIYSFTLKIYDPAKIDELALQMQSMIDSVRFYSFKEANYYRQPEVGVNFVISAGWLQAQSTTEDKKISGNQYIHCNNLGETIQFNYLDLWSQLSPFHRFTTTRDEINMTQNSLDQYAKGYIQNFFGDVKDENIHTTTYGGVDYLVCDIPLKINGENMNGEYLQRNVVTVRNGILYAFQYGYFKDNAIHEKDFDKLLNSISYDESILMAADNGLYQEMTTILYRILNIALIIVVGLLIVIALYVISRIGIDTKEENV